LLALVGAAATMESLRLPASLAYVLDDEKSRPMSAAISLSAVRWRTFLGRRPTWNVAAPAPSPNCW
jgi:hypothetical protein